MREYYFFHPVVSIPNSGLMEMSVITGLAIVYGNDTTPPPGYTKIDIDLNRGSGGEYVYLCYSTDTGHRLPITNITVFAGKSDDFPL